MNREDKLKEIALHIQGWLDYQESEYGAEGVALSDDSHLYAPPVWPTRGALKAWISVMKGD